MMKKRSREELRELAQDLVQGKITAEEYLEAILGDEPPEFEPLPVEERAASTVGLGAPDVSAAQTAAPAQRRLTDAEIDALARRAKTLL
ncbi:MAG: hypothetical protein AB7L91_14250 [Dehalococcoidia bacterium]